jgi:hypothetical protein
MKLKMKFKIMSNIMSKMKFKFMLIGLALALVLCISPVAAVSGTDFEIVHDDSQYYDTYKYCNVNDPDEKYINVFTVGTHCLKSIVTFKPANIPDAPAMLVYTNGEVDIYLPKSVDEWEIKYYSRFRHEPNICKEHLKNSGVVNLNEEFRESLSHETWLNLMLSNGQYIFTLYSVNGHICGEQWDFPEVKK